MNQDQQGNNRNNDSFAKKSNTNGNYNFCGIYGHKEGTWYKKKKKGNSIGKNKFKGNTNKYQPYDYVYTLYSQCNFLFDEYILDFGCTNHMCCQKEEFQSLYKQRSNSILIGNNTKSEVHGIRSVWINEKILYNFLYIPNLRRNLFSTLSLYWILANKYILVFIILVSIWLEMPNSNE